MKKFSIRMLVISMTVLTLCCSRDVHESGETQIIGLDLEKGDHIAIIGNTLADRMQEDGFLETYLQYRFPDKALTFRNLGFSADEVSHRQREEAFGSPDEWLKHVQADVIFAFFGFNESFRGREGLDKFKNDLADFIHHTRGQKYNDDRTPQLVLFSPIANEDIKSPHLSDGKANNKRIEMYTLAMAEVASNEDVSFVNLFTATKKLFSDSTGEHFTINGIHLNKKGNEALANAIDIALFGEIGERDSRKIRLLNDAVKDKDFHWFNRYRTTDGYNVYGGRSWLKWGDQTNRDVMLREMEMFDVMTSNRDKAVWEMAALKEEFSENDSDLPRVKVKIDDSNLPEPLTVKSYEKGSQTPREEPYTYLGAEEAITKMTIPGDLKINLFASEEQFPDLINPMQMAFDSDERLWVVTWPTYPHWNPRGLMNDKILIFPDENGDGKADTVKVFADGLNSVTGFVFWNGGVVVASPPELYFMKDTDGDDRADVRFRLLDGLSSADSHHSANSMLLGPDGALYYQRGIFNKAAIETPNGPFRADMPGVYRFDPLTFEISFHFPVGPNPHGDVFDQWGNQFATDATGGTGYYISIGKGQRARQLYEQRVRPVPGIGILSSEHFPPKYQGDLLICNVIGFQGIKEHDFAFEGADIRAYETGSLISSTDPNFRPSAVDVGGDGALYILDWHNALIGHMQHNMRDPGRDHTHGRIYRLAAKGRPLLTPVKMKGKPVEEILSHFRSRQNGTRSRARMELSGRNTDDVIAAVKKFTAGLDARKVQDAQPLLECLWVNQMHRVVDPDLLMKVLQVPDGKTRAAAVRVLGNWGTAVNNGMAILRKAAIDPDPLVRAQAVLASTSFRGTRGAETIMMEAEHLPLDIQLEEQIGYARKSMDKYWKQALIDGKPFSAAGVAFVLKHGTPFDISQLPQTEEISEALLAHPQVTEAMAAKALNNLQKLTGKSTGKLLVELVGRKSGVGANVLSMLSNLPKDALADLQNDLIALSEKNSVSFPARTAGVMALVNGGESPLATYSREVNNAEGLASLLASLEMTADEKRRTEFYPIVKTMLFKGSDRLLNMKVPVNSVMGRYVQLLLPDRDGILSLAEVEVFNGNNNIARKGSATQSSGEGNAQLAIDGVTIAKKPDAITQAVPGNDPWWQVDLGKVYSIDHINVWNRRDCCKEELQGFTLKILDENHEVILQAENLSMPDPVLNIPVAGIAPKQSLGQLAMRTLLNLPGRQADAFSDLNALLNESRQQGTVINALSDMDDNAWPDSKVKDLSDDVLSYLQKIPPFDRDQPSFENGAALLSRLGKRLPATEGKKMKSALQKMQMVQVSISSIPEKMKFDISDFTVMAGQPVKITLRNPDAMPHNLLILNPGKAEEVGVMAGKMTDGFKKNFIPDSKEIISASSLIKDGQEDVLKFMAPEKPDNYDFICSFPGHWSMMRGVMKVVPVEEDLEKYRVVYKGEKGPGLGKHIVFIASDHEYRGEETLPALARILAKNYGFTCTVVFGLDDKGNILPGSSNVRGLEVLEDADLMVIFTRFSNFINEEMQYIDNYLKRGGPVVGLRTSTHAFDNKGNSKWEHYGYDYDGPKESWKDGFGELILGETWVGHYGENHKQASRILPEEGEQDHPILRGVKDMVVQSGGYVAYPNGTVLARGQVLNGMTADAKPDPKKEMLPVAWVRNYNLESGASGRVFATTHGASEDFLNEGFRRMLVNATLWSMGMENEIKEDNNVSFVGPYKPTTFNFVGYKANVKPADLAGWDSVIMPGEVVKKDNQ